MMIHYTTTLKAGKTQCGVTVWEAVKVTANHGQVTCPECSKLLPQTAYLRAV
jgi:hypothetical protein